MIPIVQNLRAERNLFVCSARGVTFPEAKPFDVPVDFEQSKGPARRLENLVRVALPHAFDMPMEPV